MSQLRSSGAPPDELKHLLPVKRLPADFLSIFMKIYDENLIIFEYTPPQIIFTLL